MDKDSILFLCLICFALGFMLCGVLTQEDSQEQKPTAMDVYKGKTTLEITYRDSIPVDSIVVFKK